MKQITHFLIDKSQPLTETVIINIIQQHLTNNVPLFKSREKYYNGDHKILTRELDEGRPNHKVVENMVNVVTNNFNGFALGNPVKYSGDNIEPILYNLKYNDVETEDINYYKQALIYGRGVECSYLDGDGINRFTTIDPADVIPIYTADLEKQLLYVIRLITTNNYELNNQDYYIEIYDDTDKTLYKSVEGFNAIEYISKDKHYFNQIPYCIFDLNEEVEGCCDQVFSLQDSLDSLTSDSVNEVDAFVNSFLVITGANITSEQLKEMKRLRCLVLDNDSDAKFLNRDASQTNIEALKADIQNRIFEVAGCANFNDEAFGTASGIALRYKLLNMLTRTSVWLGRFKQQLQKRIELISYILSLKGDSWVEVNIEFTLNIPQDSTEYANTVATLKGIVSDETLMQLLPFVQDPKQELDKVKEQKEADMELFYNQPVNDNDLLGQEA